MSTVSTSSCLNDPSFDLMVGDCNFYAKLSTCNNIKTTTPAIPDISGNNTYCEWSNQYLECKDFTTLDDLKLDENLNLTNTIFKRMLLAPKDKIIFDSETDAFQNVRFSEDCQITLENFSGFEIFGNPWVVYGAKKISLFLTESNFEFYQQGVKINPQMCDEINKNDIFETIFNNANNIYLSYMNYSKNFCPAVFKVNIFIFWILKIVK